MSILRRKSSSTVLAAIDRHERVLLRRIHGESYWQPIKARVIPLRPSRFSAVQVVDPIFSHWFLAATPVIGRFVSAPERNRESCLLRIFVTRHDRMTPVSLRARNHTSLDVDYAWHPLSDVEDEDFDVRPRELGPFLRGYLEGWIPDGVITLVE
ncbi:hypothetical protein RKE30_37805 [Streptomyces sp. Li-HN-5-11]|uniref:hypothetical protein n=1 Tax=Streptomyces sp. Li-HN-5-11 TaxID=3075432 RepID=UPI0028B15717|nr:hypothetical protein [Streptomyces sp. Li-HN-5-11]WNM35708.1 hypothetical protein RKE30_37805 [Streptomyces sp. Li-HN-5-11]